MPPRVQIILRQSLKNRRFLMPSLSLEVTEEANRRKCARYDASLPIAVQAVDDGLAPIGDAFDAFTADLSQSGVRFFNSKPILARFALVSFVTADGEEMKLQSEVIRTKRVGAMFEVAVRFVRKIGSGALP